MQATKWGTVLAGSVLLASPVRAQSSDSSTPVPPKAVPAKGTLPAGWSARPDKGGDIRLINFITMEPGYHLTLGPATILYRSEDQIEGPFHTLATFHQMKKLEHPEGYGLFFGGRALQGSQQSYTYFLVRDDGKFLIKQRRGDATREVTRGWISHSAIRRGDAEGKASNLLEIDAKRDPGKIDFKVNDQTVYTADTGSMELKGIVGVRANHRLDIHIEGFAVHR